MTENPDLELDLRTLIERSASEVRKIAVATTQVEELFFAWAEEIAPGARAPMAIHQIDFLVQTADELANFLERLSDVAANGETHEFHQAIAHIRLASLQASLTSDVNRRENIELKLRETDAIEIF